MLKLLAYWSYVLSLQEAKLRGTDSHCSEDRCQEQVCPSQRAADPDKQLPNRRLTCTHTFSFMAPAVLAKHCSQPSSCPRFGKSSCDSQQPKSRAALGALTLLAVQGNWGCKSVQSCVLGEVLECSPWKELGNLKAFTLLLGRCEQQNKLPVKGAIWTNPSCSQVIFGKSCTPAAQWIF